MGTQLGLKDILRIDVIKNFIFVPVFSYKFSLMLSLMKLNILLFSAFFFSLISLASCKKDKADQSNQSTEVEKEADNQELPKDFNINDYKVNPWVGSYYGIIPQAGTQGLELLVTLEFNGRSHLSTRLYNTGDVGETGVSRAFWDDSGKIVRVRDYDGNFYMFLYENDQLILLDNNGNRYTGANAASYILIKSDDYDF